MTDRPDQQEVHPPLGDPPENGSPDAEELRKLQRRKRRELYSDFAIVITFLAILLAGFCVFLYKRLAG